MPTLKITIEMDNAAFAETPMSEVGRILRTYARTIEYDGEPNATLRDYNGNIVGDARVTGGDRHTSKILAALLALSLLAASPALACQGGGGSGPSGSGGSSGSSGGSSSGGSSAGSAGGDGGSGGYEPGPFPLPIPCGGVFLPWCKAESQTVEPIQ